MFERIHRDAYTVILAMVVLTGLITLMLATFNPVK
jgi:hypothetical protein